MPITWPLSPADLREFITTSLSDDALDVIIAAELETMEARLGEIGEVTDLRWPSYQETIILLGRSPSTIASIKEYVGLTEEVTLATDDYYVDRNSLRRRNDANATHPYTNWRQPVEIKYTPADDTARRLWALIELSVMDVMDKDGNSVLRRRVGDHEVEYKTATERDERRADIWYDLENATQILFA
jgi:hypothetical protein